MQYVWSPTLGTFENSPEKIWGVKEYKDDSKPTVFCGLYSLNDFIKLWRHKGKRYVWWCGTDITRFLNGYWLDEQGLIRVEVEPLAKWINKYCESWVENDVEKEALEQKGIKCNVCPSFLGDVKEFKVAYKYSDKPKLYTSVSGNDFKLYGWDKIDALAKDNRGVEFHLYGNSKPWKSKYPNVIVHGRVPKEQFNKEIKKMQGGLRLTEFDGFSEIIAKSVLMGQYPVSLIPYPFTLDTQDIYLLKHMIEPNIDGRDYYLKEINKYPWSKQHKNIKNIGRKEK